MKALSINSLDLDIRLDRRIPKSASICIMHLGRGGVSRHGELDPYNTARVEHTLRFALGLMELYPSATVRILWTGGHNRQQDRTGNRSTVSEATAAMQYARGWLKTRHSLQWLQEHRFPMETEDASTSTVGNATHSSGMIDDNEIIVVVTDRLHYLARKIQFIMWLVFPQRKRIYIVLPENPPGTTWKSRAIHLVSTAVTVVGMIGVRRGDADVIQRRQNRLQRLTRH